MGEPLELLLDHSRTLNKELLGKLTNFDRNDVSIKRNIPDLQQIKFRIIDYVILLAFINPVFSIILILRYRTISINHMKLINMHKRCKDGKNHQGC